MQSSKQRHNQVREKFPCPAKLTLAAVLHYVVCNSLLLLRISPLAHSMYLLGQENSRSTVSVLYPLKVSTAHDIVEHSLFVTHSSLGILDTCILLV